ncbi:unnamed protein product [Ceutorhynchus assimilis]|uniref:Uncharacterized protein n=1 Tax=Ceutorhynchus assimilis TaxID=467358 RepID=A0A9N9N124_9CUCU|nr:unnamed protein product [Ceutorhynchus assimilis]
MRVQLGDNVSNAAFSKLLLQIGDGDFPSEENLILIPTALTSVVNTLPELIAKIYRDVKSLQEKSTTWLCERAILTPKK